MIIIMEDFSSSFQVGTGYDNSEVINDAIWTIFSSGSGGEYGTGKIVFPSGHIEYHDNLFVYNGIDWEGTGYNSTVLHGVGAGIIANPLNGTAMNDFLLAEASNYEVPIVGLTNNPNDTAILNSPRALRDVTFRNFRQSRNGGPNAGAAFFAYTGQVGANIGSTSRFTFTDWGIEYNISDDKADINRGIDIIGGWSHKLFVPYIRNCRGQGIRVRNGNKDNSIYPANDINIFGGEIQGCYKAAELIHANKFGWFGGTCQGNGKGITIDGESRAINLSSVWMEKNNLNTDIPSWIMDKARDNAELMFPYDVPLGSHVNVGTRDGVLTRNFFGESWHADNFMPETVKIADCRMTCDSDVDSGPQEHAVIAKRAGKLGTAASVYLPGNATGGLVVENNSINNCTSYPIYLQNIGETDNDWDVYGYYVNLGNRPHEEGGQPVIHPASICNLETKYFAEFKYLCKLETGTAPVTHNVTASMAIETSEVASKTHTHTMDASMDADASTTADANLTIFTTPVAEYMGHPLYDDHTHADLIEISADNKINVFETPTYWTVAPGAGNISKTGGNLVLSSNTQGDKVGRRSIDDARFDFLNHPVHLELNNVTFSGTASAGYGERMNLALTNTDANEYNAPGAFIVELQRNGRIKVAWKVNSAGTETVANNLVMTETMSPIPTDFDLNLFLDRDGFQLEIQDNNAINNFYHYKGTHGITEVNWA